MSGRHDELPVLPEEASDLPTHVRQCALRFTSLVRLHGDLLRRIRRAEQLAWIYRAVMLPAVAALILELWAISKQLGLAAFTGP